MKSLIKKLLREGLEEAAFNSNLKGRNLLFHSLGQEYVLKEILRGNTIKANTKQEINTSKGGEKNIYSGVSLSRDSEFKWGTYQLILDGDLIRRDFGRKLTPFDFIKGYQPKSHPDRNHWTASKTSKKFKKGDKGEYVDVTYDSKFDDSSPHIEAPIKPQSEEFLIGDLKPLDKYLLGIRVRLDLTTLEPRYLRNWKENLSGLGDIPIYDHKFNLLDTDKIFANI